MTDVLSPTDPSELDAAPVLSVTPVLTLTLRDGSANAATVASPGQPLPTLGDSGKLPTVHRGLDAWVNVLRLDVTLAGVAGTLPDLELRVMADQAILEGDFLSGATITAPTGWTAVVDTDWFTGRQMLSLRPAGTMALDGSDYTASFELDNLPSGENESGNGSLTVVPVGLPAPITGYALDLPVTAVNVNAGALVVDWRFDTTGEVIVTPPNRSSRVLNDLVLVITNHDPAQPLIDPDAWAASGSARAQSVFRIRLRCADAAPGYGTLCTTAGFAAHPPTLSVDAPANDFNAVSAADMAVAQSPFWTLSLQENATTVLTAGASVQIRIAGVFSDLPLDAEGTPDPTLLTVEWQNLPGRLDSETALIISKTRRVAIDSVSVSPPPGTPLHRGDPLTVTWQTRGADHSVLVGPSVVGPEPVTLYTNDGSDAPNTANLSAEPEFPVIQVLAFGTATGATPDATSVPIELSFAAPSIPTFAGTVLQAGSHTILDLSWVAEDADYCTLSSADGVRLETSVARHRIVPSPDRPMAGAYTLNAVSGATVVQSTLGVTWRWAAAPLLPPVVTVITGGSQGGPVVVAQPLPAAAAYSPDGSTLYLLMVGANGQALRAISVAGAAVQGSDFAITLGPDSGPIVAMAACPLDGSLAATDGTTLWLLDPAAGGIRAMWTADASFGHAAGQGWGSILAPQDGTITLICGCPAQHLETLAYDPAADSLTETNRIALAQTASPPPAGALAAGGADPSGTYLAAVYSEESAERVVLGLAPWTSAPPVEIPLPPARSAARRFGGVSVQADGTQYLVIEHGGAPPAPVKCVAWTVDAGSEAIIGDPQIADGAVLSVAASPDRAQLAVALQQPSSTVFEVQQLIPAALAAPAAVPAPPIGYAYAVDAQGAAVSQFTVAGDGTLSPLTPPTVSTGPGAVAIAVSVDGLSAWVANATGQSVSQFAIGPDGTLSPQSPATVPTGGTGQGRLVAMVRSPDGRSLYVLDAAGDAQIVQFSILGGTLSPMSPATVPTISGPQDIGITPDGGSVYLISATSYVRHLIGSNGTLGGASAVQPLSDALAQKIVISPEGRAYIAYTDGKLGQFSINFDGSLAPLTPPTVEIGPAFNRVGLGTDGRSLYVTSGAGYVSQFSINADGTLTPKNPATVATGAFPAQVAASPDGASAYVANAADNTISQYNVNTDGTLTPKTPATVAAGAAPVTIALVLTAL